MTYRPTPWTQADMPAPPYFHGSNVPLEPGVALKPRVVNPNDVPEFLNMRQMVFANTCIRSALQWAYQKASARGGDMTFVYEVELQAPEVDTNIHRPWQPPPIVSVMAPTGAVLALRLAMPADAYDQDEMVQFKEDHCPDRCSLNCRQSAV